MILDTNIIIELFIFKGNIKIKELLKKIDDKEFTISII